MKKFLNYVGIPLLILGVWFGSRFMQKGAIGAEIETRLTSLCAVSTCKDALKQDFDTCYSEGFKVFGMPVRAVTLYECLMDKVSDPYLELDENFVKAAHSKFKF